MIPFHSKGTDGRPVPFLRFCGSPKQTMVDVRAPSEGPICLPDTDAVSVHRLALYADALAGHRYTDVAIRVSGPGPGPPTATFRAHMCVLATASPYFEAMFANRMGAEREGEAFKIRDVLPDAFEACMRFVYTGDPCGPAGGLTGLMQPALVAAVVLASNLLEIRGLAARIARDFVTDENALVVIDAACAACASDEMTALVDACATRIVVGEQSLEPGSFGTSAGAGGLPREAICAIAAAAVMANTVDPARVLRVGEAVLEWTGVSLCELHEQLTHAPAPAARMTHTALHVATFDRVDTRTAPRAIERVSAWRPDACDAHTFLFCIGSCQYTARVRRTVGGSWHEEVSEVSEAPEGPPEEETPIDRDPVMAFRPEPLIVRVVITVELRSDGQDAQDAQDGQSWPPHGPPPELVTIRCAGRSTRAILVGSTSQVTHLVSGIELNEDGTVSFDVEADMMFGLCTFMAGRTLEQHAAGIFATFDRQVLVWLIYRAYNGPVYDPVALLCAAVRRPPSLGWGADLVTAVVTLIEKLIVDHDELARLLVDEPSLLPLFASHNEELLDGVIEESVSASSAICHEERASLVRLLRCISRGIRRSADSGADSVGGSDPKRRRIR